MLTVRATIMQTPSPDRLEVLTDRVVTVADDGTIESVRPATGDDAADVALGPEAVLAPGMIDTHLHAPQWPQLGVGLDLPLERWLFDYTFPLEARFTDLAFATHVWDSMVPTLLAHGTTTAVYYGSLHEPATVALAEACVRYGQRAFVGRVAMDHPDGTPEWYRDPSPSAAVEASARSIDAIRSLDDPLGVVEPIITPRFIPPTTATNPAESSLPATPQHPTRFPQLRRHGPIIPWSRILRKATCRPPRGTPPAFRSFGDTARLKVAGSSRQIIRSLRSRP